ncbi:hypothetical protein GJAV_G00140330 [Gymnothorax javanicus]|nr:hypothetical protein GJAV_G00140330 [Gymnothorax javanicus]
MAQVLNSVCDGMRTNSCAELMVPQVSVRQEILRSLVSALDSVCSAMSKLDAEVACVTVHEDSVIAVGTERGRVFLNSRKEIQTDFHRFCRGPTIQILSTHGRSRDGEPSAIISKEGGRGVQRNMPESHSSIFYLRKMVEEVFSVLYSEAIGKSSLVPVPYELLLKDPSSVAVYGLPDGISFRNPSEYDANSLMKILEQSNRMRFIVKRPVEDPPQESKPCLDLDHNSSGPKSLSNHAAINRLGHESRNSMPYDFRYGMPVSSQLHPDEKLDAKPPSLLTLGKEQQGIWVSGVENMTPAMDCADNGEQLMVPGDQCHSPPGIHVSKRLLFSIVHEKSDKWDTYIQETEDINILRECVQILFNSRYAEALGLDHMVPVPYRKIASDPEAVEIIGIPDEIPFKRPCTYGAPKLKRILEERHGVRFVVKRMFDERIFTAGKTLKDKSRQKFGSSFENSSVETPRVQPSSMEVVSNAHSSRSTSSCVSPLTDGEAGSSGDCVLMKKIKTEPPDGEIIQVTVHDPSVTTDESSEILANALTPESQHSLQVLAAETASEKPTPHTPRRSIEGKDLGEMILHLRKQVDSLFSAKYSEAMGLLEPTEVPYSSPNCFGVAKLRKILAVGDKIHFVIKRPELLCDAVKQEDSPLPASNPAADLDSEDSVLDDAPAAAKRPGYSDIIEAKLSRIDMANALREQVQDLFNRKYGEALGINYPVQVPYKRIKSNPGSVIIEGLPPGIPLRKPCTFGSQNLERILAAADKISFTITRPFQGLIPKPAPRRISLLKKAHASINDDDEANRMGKKVILREQVKDLFNKKYGEALGLSHSVLVPYKLIRGSPDSVQVSGLPDDVPFCNPNIYDRKQLEKILLARSEIAINIKSQLQPYAEICTQTCNTEKEGSSSRRKRKRVPDGSQVTTPPGAETGLSTNRISVMQWPMYMADYSGVNAQVPDKVKY